MDGSLKFLALVALVSLSPWSVIAMADEGVYLYVMFHDAKIGYNTTRTKMVNMIQCFAASNQSKSFVSDKSMMFVMWCGGKASAYKLNEWQPLIIKGNKE